MVDDAVDDLDVPFEQCKMCRGFDTSTEELRNTQTGVYIKVLQCDTCGRETKRVVAEKQQRGLTFPFRMW